MYKHTLTTKYPLWAESSVSVTMTDSEQNPFTMFSVDAELKKIQKDVDLAKSQSIERGGNGELFCSNWSFQRKQADVEIIKSLGIEITIEYTRKDDVMFKPLTISGYKQLKEHDLYTIGVPTQDYSCMKVELDSSFISEVDKLESRAQSLWSSYDPEPACNRLYSRAMALCNTALEREYVDSRSWI